MINQMFNDLKLRDQLLFYQMYDDQMCIEQMFFLPNIIAAII